MPAKKKLKAPKKSEIPKASGIVVHCAHRYIADITELKPNPLNPNSHPEAQIALLAKVIRQQGWRYPITVSARSGLIVSGHGRLEAAKVLNVDQVPLDVQHFASEEQETACLLADNRLAELAEMDREKLKDMLEGLDLGEFDMDLTGYDEKSIEDLMTAFRVDPTEPPDLSQGAGNGFQKMTLTVSDNQAGIIEDALKKAKADGHGESSENENSNGNAAAWIFEAYLNG